MCYQTAPHPVHISSLLFSLNPLRRAGQVGSRPHFSGPNRFGVFGFPFAYPVGGCPAQISQHSATGAPLRDLTASRPSTIPPPQRASTPTSYKLITATWWFIEATGEGVEDLPDGVHEVFATALLNGRPGASEAEPPSPLAVVQADGEGECPHVALDAGHLLAVLLDECPASGDGDRGYSHEGLNSRHHFTSFGVWARVSYLDLTAHEHRLRTVGADSPSTGYGAPCL